MKLKALLSYLNTPQVIGPDDREISGLAYDSRRVKKGDLFFALGGAKANGNQFIDAAVQAGAVAIVTEEPRHNPHATVIVVASARKAMADLSAAFYRFPSLTMKTVGVTGTNGKTTFTFLLKRICQEALMPCGLIGTVRYEIGERQLPAPRTTPESLDLQEMLFQIRSAGSKATAMEVSSHALVQERARGVEFDVAVFTNLTQDHLDFHGTMENYFAAKTLLFSTLLNQKKKKGTAVINIDDRFGVRLADQFAGKLPLITYGMGVRADFQAKNIVIDFNGTSFHLVDRRGTSEKSFLVRLPLIGRFNVYNALAAITAAVAIGIDTRTAIKALAEAPSVPGRLEPVPVKRQFKVFVDYAHTPDALVNVMRTLKELSPRRLMVVFGCGGNRDKAKRPLMAGAVAQYADFAIATSDNPRSEKPEDILREIQKGFPVPSRLEVETIVDRKEAIYRAISLAEPRDIVLIAGKGHETYQEFADHTIPFDDLQVAQQALEAKPVEIAPREPAPFSRKTTPQP
jgi:UDP-N-acetylmuramoyl-L-alanyl-D-glutamate--2,6-diaminopimelate ligase